MRRFFKKSWKAAALAVAIVLIPTVAFAAVGTFTSSTATPAVKGTNSSTANLAAGVNGIANGTGTSVRYGVLGTATGTNGIGVQGTGPKFGVYSNGPLGVLGGKLLICAACVTAADLGTGSVTSAKLGTGSVTSGALAAGSVNTAALGANSVDGTKIQSGAVGSSALASGAVGPAALSSAAKNNVLESGQSVSGVFNSYDAAGGKTFYSFNYRRPLAAPITNVVNTAAGADPVHCPFPGSASPDYLCIYPGSSLNFTTGDGLMENTADGVVFGFKGNTATLSFSYGTFTVTAP